ncbi:MAG: hypothetical protein A2X45_04365 [Lentisphaerae bacterium GWF2_50_93]|nr:MAG: hypothetical protein A2X45_04365 [Lentisphaerae bacterium GWF2_50_93]
MKLEWGMGFRFTLVEMLVVMAIISIMMSMMLPALAKAREKARESVCRGNLKQIGSATGSYSDENNGYAMPCIFQVTVGGSSKYFSWIDYLYNCSSINPETARCPTMRDEECYDPYGGQSIPLPRVITRASYTMNVIGMGAWGGADIGSDPAKSCGWGYDSCSPVSLKRVRNLSGSILITDVLRRKPEYTLTDSDVTRIVSYLETDHGEYPIGTGSEKRDVGEHHSYCFNSLFGDGHVETLRSSEPKQWVVFVGP